MSNYNGRKSNLDARSHDLRAIPRQDNMQHAAAVDPLVLRRTLLVSGTAGQAARAVRPERRRS